MQTKHTIKQHNKATEVNVAKKTSENSIITIKVANKTTKSTATTKWAAVNVVMQVMAVLLQEVRSLSRPIVAITIAIIIVDTRTKSIRPVILIVTALADIIDKMVEAPLN